MRGSLQRAIARTVILGVGLALIVGGAPLWAQDPGHGVPEPGPEDQDGPEVVELEFKGARSLDTQLLEDVIVTRATRCRSPLYFVFCLLDVSWAVERSYLDPEELARDEERLEELYTAWGFPDVRVQTVVVPRSGDRVEVEFEIDEGEPIVVASVAVHGLNTLDPPVEVDGPLPLRAGELYALPLLEETRLLLVEAFAERGHPYVEVTIEGEVDEAAREADVVFETEPGPQVVFGDVEVEAQPPLGEDVVIERLAFEPGDLYRPSALAETEWLLRSISIVDSVQIEPVGLEEGQTVVSPRIVVGAGRAQAVQLEGTVSSRRCLQAVGSWAHRYFMGSPRSVTLSAGASNLLADQLGGSFPCTGTGKDDYAKPNYFVQAEVRQPWPGTPRTEVLVSGFASRESEPFVYVQRGYGGRLGVLRRFRPDLIGSLLYSPQRSALSAADVYFCGNYGECGPRRLGELTGYRWHTPLRAEAFWTPTGPPQLLRRAGPGERWRRWVNGTAGVAARMIGSDYEYVRGVGEVGLTRLFGTQYELGGRGRFGLVFDIGDVLPPQARLYGGGVNSVRGVRQNQLGPKLLLVSPERADELGCELVPDGCPSDLTVGRHHIGVRPAGGEAIVEMNLEGRAWLTDAVQGVVFADYGMVRRRLGGGNHGLFGSDAWETIITPGLGVRVASPIGPVRIDVAYNPSGAHRYPLLARDPETDDLVALGSVRYAPYSYDDPGRFREFWRRLHVHFGVGQAF